ncbi:hypothetical protein AX14_004244 [Amanita brunnescens Koide BX004]|nr:hypothetical protein AX14_004244 [Amanita brunnescens Koide BX004]
MVDLRGFAYLAAQPLINTASGATRASTPSQAGPSRVVEPKFKKRNRANLFVDDLPSDHVAKLTKCVSCDARWTTRKSASQKKKHIQSCARKKGFTPYTIQVALCKEVESVKAMNKSGRKDKEPDPSENTLLENTVNAAAKGKKTRHRTKKTVESITITRNSILDRAKQILAYPTQPAGDDGGTDVHDEELPMASTQPFGRSDLEEQYLSVTKLFTEASADSPARSRTPFADNYVKNALTHHGSDVSAISDSLNMMGQCDGHHSSGKEKEAAIRAAGHNNGEGGLERRGVDVDSFGTDEQWIHQFRSLILQDRDLHLSILRYEVSIALNGMDI